jgi:hypothetical protein
MKKLPHHRDQSRAVTARPHERVLFVFVLVSCMFSAALISLGSFPQAAVSQTSGGNISGYAWSDTIGWVSFNCSDGGPTGNNICGTLLYGLNADVNGTVTGYAWSDNVGWISANAGDLTGCPQAPCTARIDDGDFLGWLKVLSANDSQSGGWDGFIALGDTNTGDAINYGVSLANGTFSGYAWGDTNVGWLSFSSGGSYAVTTTYVPIPPCQDTQGYFCTGNTSNYRDDQCNETPVASCSNYCEPLIGVCVPTPGPSGNLEAKPTFVQPGGTVEISWNIADAGTCTVTEDNPTFDDSWSGASSDSATCTHSGSACVSGAISQATTYTLFCDNEGVTLQQTVTVDFVPEWREI